LIPPLTYRYVWANEISEWIPKEDVKRPYRLNGVPATPPTRIIPDEELPYYNTPSPISGSRPDSVAQGNHHVTAPKPTGGSTSGTDQSPSYSIKIEELPADKIDSPGVGAHGDILSTVWEYVTLFWRV
jgi:hypothetical protein